MSILSNLYVLLVLRIAHVGGSIVWAGSAFLYMLVLAPAVKSSASAGQAFMRNFGPRFGSMMKVATTVTVVSGALLYERFFAGGIGFMWKTGIGLALSVGAVAAFVSYAMGIAYLGPMQGKIEALGEKMSAANGAPSVEQVNEMKRLQFSLMKAYQFDFVLLIIAMLTMAVARYLPPLF